MAFRKPNKPDYGDEEKKVMRVPLPRGREVLGIIEQRYGEGSV